MGNIDNIFRINISIDVKQVYVIDVGNAIKTREILDKIAMNLLMDGPWESTHIALLHDVLLTCLPKKCFRISRLFGDYITYQLWISARSFSSVWQLKTQIWQEPNLLPEIRAAITPWTTKPWVAITLPCPLEYKVYTYNHIVNLSDRNSIPITCDGCNFLSTLGLKLFRVSKNWLWLKTDIASRNKRVPDSKVLGANIGPIWVLSAPDMSPMLAPWYLLSGVFLVAFMHPHSQYKSNTLCNLWALAWQGFTKNNFVSTNVLWIIVVGTEFISRYAFVMSPALQLNWRKEGNFAVWKLNAIAIDNFPTKLIIVRWLSFAAIKGILKNLYSLTMSITPALTLAFRLWPQHNYVCWNSV